MSPFPLNELVREQAKCKPFAGPHTCGDELHRFFLISEVIPVSYVAEYCFISAPFAAARSEKTERSVGHYLQ